MGRIKIQASQTAPQWNPLPKGTYDFAIDSVEEKPTKSGGAQLVFKMTVLDGPSAGKKATHFQSLSEKSGGFIKEIVEAAGIEFEQEELEIINEDDGKPFLSIDFDSDDFIGRNVRCDAIETEHEGRAQNKFNRFRSIEADEAPAPEPQKRTAATTQQRQPAATQQAPAGNRTQQRQAPAAGTQPRRSRV